MKAKKKPFILAGIVAVALVAFVLSNRVLGDRLSNGKSAEVVRFDEQKQDLFLMVGMTQGYLVQDAEAVANFLRILSNANKIAAGNISYDEAYLLQNDILRSAELIADMAEGIAPLAADPMFKNALARFRTFRDVRTKFIYACRKRAEGMKWLSFGRDVEKDFCG